MAISSDSAETQRANFEAIERGNRARMLYAYLQGIIEERRKYIMKDIVTEYRARDYRVERLWGQAGALANLADIESQLLREVKQGQDARELEHGR